MKKILFPLLVLSFANLANTQDNKILVNRIMTNYNYEITDKVFDKLSGKKLKSSEVQQILIEHPNIALEPEIDKYGEVVKYYYDSQNIKTISERNENLQTKAGEVFPEFVFKTIDGETIKSENLNGKYVLIRFEAFALARFFKKKEIEKLDFQILNLGYKSNIESIICFADSKENILKEINLGDTNFKLVADGKWFHEKFNIVHFPTTLLLDKEGKVINHYSSSDEIDLKTLLK